MKLYLCWSGDGDSGGGDGCLNDQWRQCHMHVLHTKCTYLFSLSLPTICFLINNSVSAQLEIQSGTWQIIGLSDHNFCSTLFTKKGEKKTTTSISRNSLLCVHQAEQSNASIFDTLQLNN